MTHFSGSVRLPFPDIDFAKGASVADPIYAAAGYDYGRNHPEVSVPLVSSDAGLLAFRATRTP